MANKSHIRIVNFILFFIITQVASLSVIRDKRDYQSGNNYAIGSDQSPYSSPLAPLYPSGSGSAYESPLAPFPSQDQIKNPSHGSYVTQPGIKGGPSGRLVNSYNNSQYNQPYNNPQSGHNPLYPSLSSVQQWNQSSNTNQNYYGNSGDQTRPLGTGTNYGSQGTHGNQGPYGNQGTHVNPSSYGNQGSYGSYGSNTNQGSYGNQGPYGYNQFNQTRPGTPNSGNQGPYNTYGNQRNQTRSFNDPSNPWSRTTLGPHSGNQTKSGNQWNQPNYGNQGAYGTNVGNRGIPFSPNNPNSSGYTGSYNNQWNQTRPGVQGSFGVPSNQYSNYPSNVGPHTNTNNPWNQTYNAPNGPHNNQYNPNYPNNSGSYGSYGNQWNQTYPGYPSNTQGSYASGIQGNQMGIKSRISAEPSRNSEEFSRCTSSCQSSTNYAPVCGSDLKTYSNLQHLECAHRCGSDVRFAYNGSC